ncbi:TetR/AcrR family transcriptional regulator [Azoarcus sp. KH32C]|uniref:TetR/AcrR family transcriptional regulator n=1 Tax=Azoarcus sp. KH32C TaxID=748247 RepID=UPI0002386121|nr:TetR/AcrR family transcriptional regulator [Azoarcus sp. KH32C]BAL24043.1 transcriptional regulator, TetR family [Azoarcus sp. KH32C]
MKVSREQAAENRQRVVEIAAKLFRERGLDGIGVADLMKSAGLTHGGFYGHFGSKEDLMAEACTRAMEGSLSTWRERIDAAPEKPLAAVAELYLSTAHCQQAGDGCALAALGSEASRHAPPVRHALTEGLRELIELLTTIVPGRSKAARRERALATFASMVGAIVLARSADDPALGEEILRSVSASILGSH